MRSGGRSGLARLGWLLFPPSPNPLTSSSLKGLELDRLDVVDECGHFLGGIDLTAGSALWPPNEGSAVPHTHPSARSSLTCPVRKEGLTLHPPLQSRCPVALSKGPSPFWPVSPGPIPSGTLPWPPPSSFASCLPDLWKLTLLIQPQDLMIPMWMSHYFQPLCCHVPSVAHQESRTQHLQY